MTDIPQKRLLRFGIFEADPQTGELRKQGRRLALQGQPFDILLMLLESPGELVSRAQIRERLWPNGTFVDFDHSLNTAINKIRDVLGDSAANPRFVETLSRRGYRFVAPVQVADGNMSSMGVSAMSVAISSERSLSESSAVRPPEPQAEETPRSSLGPADGLLTRSGEVPSASRAVVRALFLLLQVMYLCFYLVSLARLHAVEEIVAASLSHPVWTVVVLVVTAVVGIPIRLFLISSVAFNTAGLQQKFLRLFPVMFPLDELWALAPFLLLEQIGYGLALGMTAILLYVPFAQRSLILMGAGRTARVEAIGS